MFSPSKVASLTMGVSVALLVVFVFWKQEIPCFRLIYVAFFSSS